MRARRAILYMPGDDMHKIRKAATLGVDTICMDMEDGVATDRKKEARKTITEALQEIQFGTIERLVRINAVGSGLEAADLAAVLTSRPDGVVLPKVEFGGQIRWVSQSIADVENHFGWPKGGICLLAVVETARGILNLSQIAGADPRLEALIFGAEDLAADIGAIRTKQGLEVSYARGAVVMHAAAFGLQAIDMVYLDFTDLEGLFQEAVQGAQMAFAGKQIIHPNQVEPVQRAFTPNEASIRLAQHIMEAYATWQKAGVGAFALDGKMVDAPVIKAAERVLALAHSARKI